MDRGPTWVLSRASHEGLDVAIRIRYSHVTCIGLIGSISIITTVTNNYDGLLTTHLHQRSSLARKPTETRALSALYRSYVKGSIITINQD